MHVVAERAGVASKLHENCMIRGAFHFACDRFAARSKQISQLLCAVAQTLKAPELASWACAIVARGGVLGT